MTAAYFEDHPTDPDKVILRKPYSTDCPNCEYHRQRAQRWRDEAYKQAGHPLPEREDDHALIDAGLLNSDLGMLRTRGTRLWVGLTEAQCGVLWKVNMTPFDYYKAIEAKLKEKNT